MRAKSQREEAKILVRQDYWEDSYCDLKLSIAAPQDQVRLWIEQFVPPAHAGETCLEIGCYPGRYLAVLGELGYRLNGIDRTPHVVKRLPDWLKSLGFPIAEFRQENFLAASFAQPYDLVCSFGFIEHFENWREVLARHVSLVAPGGRLIVTAPNFRGTVQRFFHRLLDYPNLQRHHIPSMNPDQWSNDLKGHGWTVQFSGYFGEFDFWVDRPPSKPWQQRLLRWIDQWKPLLTRWGGGFHTAPYCGLIAVKDS